MALTEPQLRRQRVAAIKRHHPDRDDLIAEATQDLAEAKLEACIRKIVDGAPPLTTERRERLAAILRGGRRA